MPYMPAGVVSVSDIQANYLCARSPEGFCVALSNQSDKEIVVELAFDPEKSGVSADKLWSCRVWKQNREVRGGKVRNGRIRLRLAPKGITAVLVKGAHPSAPFQERIGGNTVPKWTVNHCSTGFHRDRAVLMDFGEGLCSVYVWNEADNTVFSRVLLHCSVDGGPERIIEKRGYPYEYTVEIPDGAESFTYSFEAYTPEGECVVSGEGRLAR